ncbi:MAG: CBS domain-containing protein [Nitrososphaeraceae archaeon]
MSLEDILIKDAAPQIFRRPFLFVGPNSHLLKTATFLAIGPQIYVDGLLVIDKGRGKEEPIGRISSKQIISKILNLGYPEWLDLKASQIMDSFVGNIEMDSPLSAALEIFEKTRFAFVPIIAKDSSIVAASLSIRDILPLIAKTNIDRPIKDLSSPLISVDKNTTIRTALDLMIEGGIRNIGIEDNDAKNNNNNKLLRIINDRKILEFLLSHRGRKIMRRDGIAGLADINIINHLDMISATKVNCHITISNAAELLMDIRNPCLILEVGENNSIVTPWDIVMRTLRSDLAGTGDGATTN